MLLKDTINIISLIASSIGLLILLSLAYVRPKLMNRVSLQLQAGIALLDITRHIYFIVNFNAKSSFCAFIAFYGFFSNRLYVLLNVAIALNLHLFLILRYQPRHYVIWIYFSVSILISLVFDSIPLGLGYMGKASKGDCYLKTNIANRRLVKLFLVHVINWPGIIYCLIISVIVISQYIFGKIKDIDDDNDIIWLPEVRGLSFMISLNSLTCFITMFFYLLNEFLFDWFDFKSQVSFDLAGFLARSTGILNLVCLLSDYQILFAIIGCASPRKPTSSSNYELTKKENYGQPNILRPNRNPVLDATDFYIAKNSERENLINFL